MRFQAVVLSEDRFNAWASVYNEPPKVVSNLEQKGQELFMSKTCFTCHAIEGTMAQGKIGPNLSNFGNRSYLAAGTLKNTHDNMVTWLKDTVYSEADHQKVKPGNLMLFSEGYELSDEEIEALIAYLHRSTAKTY